MRRVQLLSSSWKPKVLSMEFFGFSTKSQGHFGAVKGIQRPSGLQIWSQALSIEDNLSCHWENPAGISGIRITFWLGGIPAWQMGWHHPPAVPTPFLVHAWYTDRDDFQDGIRGWQWCWMSRHPKASLDGIMALKLQMDLAGCIQSDQKDLVKSQTNMNLWPRHPSSNRTWNPHHSNHWVQTARICSSK